MLTRRDLLRSATAGAAALVLPTTPALLRADDAKGFTLPKLPYAFDALEPAIDAKTMEIHHDKHHQAYVDNLNKALAKHPDWLAKPIVEVVRDYKKLPAELQTPVRNNGGGHLNHTWFWQMMTKPGGAGPSGELLKAIETSFGSLDGFKKEFTAAATTQFGSGWAWLVKGKEKPLEVVKLPNQDNPVTDGRVVLLGVDVWEHAYYLKYQNKRADYVAAWYGVVNWPFVAELYAAK
ncbi:superoxide dismutase [Frigoriglobus tundricola]|uniref:Superoxide dismutase n=1 Tax=Frigoriglobus tundricola TaxID=2774151 RepID=A0A6M5YM11_9BACT|nr:superoxide dismutase [Frigoriglobus tundricola]QJW95139.1 Superoxide dismutase [Mn] [Frigoriglobus tundricola]